MKTRGRKSNHNLVFSPKLNSAGEFIIYVRHNFGSGKISHRKTDLKIPAKAWDKKKKEVKSRKEFAAYRTRFNLLAKRRNEILDQLNQNLITVESALNAIPLYNQPESIVLLNWFEDDYLENKRNLSNDYTKKIYSIISEIDKALIENKKQHLVPAKLDYFKNPDYLAEIANSLFKAKTKNTATDYLKKLNTVLKGWDRSYFQSLPFQEYYQTEATNLKRPVTINELIAAIPKINSYKRLEAYLFWLYSFCLRGLDGQDVTLVSDKLKVEPTALNDYIFEQENNDDPIHIEIKRKKTSARTFTVLVNAYPTLSILKLLKQVLEITRPNEVNQDDELKLFKWDVVSNKRKWDLYSDFIQGRLKKLIGQSFKSTRHTIASTAERVGADLNLQSALIGNISSSGSIKHYSSLDEKKLDLIHLDIIGRFQVIRIYLTLVKHIKASEILDIDPVRKIDQLVYGINKTKHLDKSWQEIQRRYLDNESDTLDFDLDSNVFKGTL